MQQTAASYSFQRLVLSANATPVTAASEHCILLNILILQDQNELLSLLCVGRLSHSSWPEVWQEAYHRAGNQPQVAQATGLDP